VARQFAVSRREIAVDFGSVFEREEGEQREGRGGFIGGVLMAITARITGGVIPSVSRRERIPGKKEDLTRWSHLSARKKRKEKEKKRKGYAGEKQASWAAARLVWAPGRPSWADAVLFSFFLF
jgi:hypothetical protein